MEQDLTTSGATGASGRLSRRAMMRTAVLAAGVAAWSAPQVLSVTADPAHAGSPAPGSTGSTDSTGSGGLLTDVVDDTVSTADSLLKGLLGGGR